MRDRNASKTRLVQDKVLDALLVAHQRVMAFVQDDDETDAVPPSVRVALQYIDMLQPRDKAKTFLEDAAAADKKELERAEDDFSRWDSIVDAMRRGEIAVEDAALMEQLRAEALVRVQYLERRNSGGTRMIDVSPNASGQKALRDVLGE